MKVRTSAPPCVYIKRRHGTFLFNLNHFCESYIKLIHTIFFSLKKKITNFMKFKLQLRVYSIRVTMIVTKKKKIIAIRSSDVRIIRLSNDVILLLYSRYILCFGAIFKKI